MFFYTENYTIFFLWLLLLVTVLRILLTWHFEFAAMLAAPFILVCISQVCVCWGGGVVMGVYEIM